MSKISSKRDTDAALMALIVVQISMLMALFTQTAPHPPLTTPLFALGPFLASSVATALAALTIGSTHSKRGMLISALAAILALVSLGPHKWLDPAISGIWPAIVVGHISAAAILWACLKGWKYGDLHSKPE